MTGRRNKNMGQSGEVKDCEREVGQESQSDYSMNAKSPPKKKVKTCNKMQTQMIAYSTPNQLQETK